MIVRLFSSLTAVVATCMFFSSCFSVSDTLEQPCKVDEDCNRDDRICIANVCEDSSSAEIRLVHAASGVDSLDLYRAGSVEPLVTDLDFKNVSEWIRVAEEELNLEFREAGAAASEPPLFTTEKTAISGQNATTLIFTGIKDGEGDDALRILPIVESWGGDLANKARVRLVHAGPDAPEFLVEGLEGADFEIARYGDSTATGTPITTEGGERIQLFEGDTVRTGFTLPPFREGSDVLLVATGLLDSLAREQAGFSLLAISEEGLQERVLQDPQIFTLHGSRDAGALENCTNGLEVATNFEYGEIQSAFLSPGEYSFELFNYPSGCSANVLNPRGNIAPALDSGERYLILITGELTPEDDPGETAIQVAPFVDRFSPDAPDEALIRFVHGASFSQIIVGNKGAGEKLITADNVYTDPIAWRQESRESRLEGDAYNLGLVDPSANSTPPLKPIVELDTEVTKGSRQWGIVSGDPSPTGPDGFIQLMLVDTAQAKWTVQLVDFRVAEE